MSEWFCSKGWYSLSGNGLNMISAVEMTHYLLSSP